MTDGAGAEVPAEPVVSLRMTDGSEVRRLLRDVRARQLGTTTVRLARQVWQLEDAAGTALLRTGPGGRLTLTAHGRLLARDVHPVPDSCRSMR